MQPNSSPTPTTENDVETPATENAAQDTPTLYRKEFLQVVLGRAQFVADKLVYSRKTAETNLSVARDMLFRMPEHFEKADIFVKHLIVSPENAHSGAAGFNKHVFFESTPAKMEAMKAQLDYIREALEYGLTATNGAEFRDRTETTQKLLNESVAEMGALCGVKQTQR